jgi:hypothetical protein
MNHGPAFQALCAELRKDIRKLQNKGYYGDGKHSEFLATLLIDGNCRSLVIRNQTSRRCQSWWFRYPLGRSPTIYGAHFIHSLHMPQLTNDQNSVAVPKPGPAQLLHVGVRDPDAPSKPDLLSTQVLRPARSARQALV